MKSDRLGSIKEPIDLTGDGDQKTKKSITTGSTSTEPIDLTAQTEPINPNMANAPLHSITVRS